MTAYQKEYELLHDIRKIQRPQTGSYDTLEKNHLSILHDPQLKYSPKVVFPGGLYPPKGKMIERLNWAFQNPMGTPKTWRTDGYIEEDIAPNNGKITDRTVILCLFLVTLLTALLLYMTIRLVSNGYCRYRRNRAPFPIEKALREKKGLKTWGQWIDHVSLRFKGARQRDHWERFGGKRMHSYPV